MHCISFLNNGPTRSRQTSLERAGDREARVGIEICDRALRAKLPSIEIKKLTFFIFFYTFLFFKRRIIHVLR